MISRLYIQDDEGLEDEVEYQILTHFLPSFPCHFSKSNIIV
jgi:hypothetical protein